MLVKKGIVDCDNGTQCDDDKDCFDSYKKPGRKLCEPVCDRLECPVEHSECVGLNHIASCECKEGFHGNGTDFCVPDGFNGVKFSLRNCGEPIQTTQTFGDSGAQIMQVPWMVSLGTFDYSSNRRY